MKPKKLSKMIEIAENLSKGFTFVRVDLYYSNDSIYFGELTFTPAAGLDTSFTIAGDKMLSSEININKR
jgi:hypothetical protein